MCTYANTSLRVQRRRTALRRVASAVLLLWCCTAWCPCLSAADSTAVVSTDPVAAVLRRSFSLPPLSLFPGDRAAFNTLRYDRVDGLFFGLGSDKRAALDSTLFLQYSLGYGFGSHYWQATAGAGYRIGDRNNATVFGGEVLYHTDSYDTWKLPVWEQSLRAFVAGEEHLRRFRRMGWAVYWQQSIERRVSLAVRVGHERVEPLARAVSWSLFGAEDAFPDNINFSAGAGYVVSVAGGYNGMPPLHGARVGGRVHVVGEQRIGDINCGRWLAEAAVHVPTGSVLTLNARLRAGAQTGETYVPGLLTLGGAGTLPGYAWNEYTGNRMVLLNTELLVHPAAFMGGRLAASVSLVLMCDIGAVAWAPSHGATAGVLMSGTGRWNTSLGIALGSAHGALRIGAAWRTDRAAPPQVLLRFSPVVETSTR